MSVLNALKKWDLVLCELSCVWSFVANGETEGEEEVGLTAQ